MAAAAGGVAASFVEPAPTPRPGCRPPTRLLLGAVRGCRQPGRHLAPLRRHPAVRFRLPAWG